MFVIVLSFSAWLMIKCYLIHPPPGGLAEYPAQPNASVEYISGIAAEG
jgi:hypothetical protein